MSIYVAGSWYNREYIKKEWIDKLPSHGLKCQHDWTQAENKHSMDENFKNLRDHAILDFNAASKADCVLVIMNEPQSLQNAYRGTFCEIGIAYTRKVPIIIFNPDHHSDLGMSGLMTNVFYWLPGIAYCTTEEEVWQQLLKLKWRSFCYLITVTSFMLVYLFLPSVLLMCLHLKMFEVGDPTEWAPPPPLRLALNQL